MSNNLKRLYGAILLVTAGALFSYGVIHAASFIVGAASGLLAHDGWGWLTLKNDYNKN